jgi:hypothetical protein
LVVSDLDFLYGGESKSLNHEEHEGARRKSHQRKHGIKSVEAGIAADDRGDLIEQEEVRARLNQILKS